MAGDRLESVEGPFRYFNLRIRTGVIRGWRSFPEPCRLTGAWTIADKMLILRRSARSSTYDCLTGPRTMGLPRGPSCDKRLAGPHSIALLGVPTATIAGGPPYDRRARDVTDDNRLAGPNTKAVLEVPTATAWPGSPRVNAGWLEYVR